MTQRPRSTPPLRPPWLRSLRVAAWGVLGLTVLLMLGLTAVLTQLWFKLPPLDKVTHYQPQQSLQIFTQDGVPIGQFGAERRQFTPITDIPPLLQAAVLAVEDTRFRQHPGIDPIGIGRALIANLSGGMYQGASTITQQVARNFFLSPSRTLERKVTEALLALRIEHELDKAHILELYMNQIYLGQRSYGFTAAAQTYFGKTLHELSVAETAMLAGLPQNPGYANPITNLTRARARQALVLARMHKVGLITEVQRVQAQAEILNIRSPLQAEVHAEYLAEMARQAVIERFGEAAYALGYKVYTTVKANEQMAAYTAVRKAVMEHDRQQPYRGPEGYEALPDLQDSTAEAVAAQVLRDHRDDPDLPVALVTSVTPSRVVAQTADGDAVTLTGVALQRVQAALQPNAPPQIAIRRGAVIRLARQDSQWVISQWPEVQAAFVALTPKTGHLRALVGGFDFTRSSFNRVTQGWRQAGSTLKPLIYSAALEHGVMPETWVNDAPLNQAVDDVVANGWQPNNADGRFDGAMTMRNGLVRSKNLVSIRLLAHVGLAQAREWLGRFGLDLSRQPDNLTLALGSGSTTPLQLALAYSVFAQGGYSTAPFFIDHITDAQGMEIYRPPRLPGHDTVEPVIPARNAFVINTLLQDVTRIGTAAGVQRALLRSDLYGKTGTTNDATDAWFAGFQPHLVAVAWMGYDESRSLGDQASGATLAMPMWIDFMAEALNQQPEHTPMPPEGLVLQADDWRYAEWSPDRPGSVLQLGWTADDFSSPLAKQTDSPISTTTTPAIAATAASDVTAANAAVMSTAASATSTVSAPPSPNHGDR